MKAHYVNIVTRSQKGHLKENFEQVTTRSKTLKFKTPREVLRIEGFHTNEVAVAVGFLGAVIELKPGEVMNFASEKFTDSVQLRRAV